LAEAGRKDWKRKEGRKERWVEARR
jgi:hypothetical protein